MEQNQNHKQIFPHLLASVEAIRFSPFILKSWRFRCRKKAINKYNGNLDILLDNVMEHDKTSVHLLILNRSLHLHLRRCKIRRKNDKYIILSILQQKTSQLNIFLPKWGCSYKIIIFLFGDDIIFNYFFSPILQDK